jgi:hypothetical protein
MRELKVEALQLENKYFLSIGFRQCVNFWKDTSDFQALGLQKAFTITPT